MTCSPLNYRIHGASWTLELSSKSVCKLLSYAQRRMWSKESVGQLYTPDPGAKVVKITEISKLISSWSSYSGVRFNIKAMENERAEYFDKGLHCVGIWHSHPEEIPSPSSTDKILAADHALAGSAQYAGLVFLIVGTAAAEKGIGVWVHDGETIYQAELIGASHEPINLSGNQQQ